jgi:hypothetical protein
MNVHVEDVTFRSEGVDCAGTLYLPADAGHYDVPSVREACTNATTGFLVKHLSATA